MTAHRTVTGSPGNSAGEMPYHRPGRGPNGCSGNHSACTVGSASFRPGLGYLLIFLARNRRAP